MTVYLRYKDKKNRVQLQNMQIVLTWINTVAWQAFGVQFKGSVNLCRGIQVVGYQIKISTGLFLVEPDFCFTTVKIIVWLLHNTGYVKNFTGVTLEIVFQCESGMCEWNNHVRLVFYSINHCLGETFLVMEIVLSHLQQLAFFPKRSEPCGSR